MSFIAEPWNFNTWTYVCDFFKMVDIL